jgi:hypothetical protein
MHRVAVPKTHNRGRLAYDPLDPDRVLRCRHPRRDPVLLDAILQRQLGPRGFVLPSGERVTLRFVDEGETYIMRHDHPHASDELLGRAECVVCGALIDLKCKVEAARQAS